MQFNQQQDPLSNRTDTEEVLASAAHVRAGGEARHNNSSRASPAFRRATGHSIRREGTSLQLIHGSKTN